MWNVHETSDCRVPSTYRRKKNENKQNNELLMAIVDQGKFNVKSDVLVSYRWKGDSQNMTRAKAAKMERFEMNEVGRRHARGVGQAVDVSAVFPICLDCVRDFDNSNDR
jgi:hypothetical protein